MDEAKMVQVLAAAEDERSKFHAPGGDGVGFDMTAWLNLAGVDGNKCGTTACLAGHAALMEGYVNVQNQRCRDPKTGLFSNIEDAGRDILGLTEYESDEVFYLDTLEDVYCWVAQEMVIPEQVLREKVAAERIYK